MHSIAQPHKQTDDRQTARHRVNGHAHDQLPLGRRAALRDALDFNLDVVLVYLKELPDGRVDKVPCMKWKNRRYLTPATEAELEQKWKYLKLPSKSRYPGAQPNGMALICGQPSGRFILDFDGPEGEKTRRRLGLAPNVTTQGGWSHVHVEGPPGLKIPSPTYNQNLQAKDELHQRLAKEYPGMDIRAEKSLAVFWSRFKDRNGEIRSHKVHSLKPVEWAELPLELRRDLQALAEQEEHCTHGKINGHALGHGNSGTISETALEKMEAFLEQAGIKHEPRELYNGGYKWILNHCWFDPSHDGTSTAVFLSADGVPGYRCLQNPACSDYHWKEFSESVEQKTGCKVSFREPVNSLEELNRQFAVCCDPVCILNTDTGAILSRKDFDLLLANRFLLQKMPSGRDNKLQDRKVKLSTCWVEWEHRRQVERMVYEPLLPGQVREDGGVFNRWRGWGCLPEEGDVRPWYCLLDVVFGENATTQHWFEDWCAYPLQHPGFKLGSAVVLWSALQGVGKNTLARTLARIYGVNARFIKEDELLCPFNEWLRDKQFVIADECTGGDKRTHADRLKVLIGEKDPNGETITINEKFQPQYQVRDCVNFLFMSNHPDPVHVEKFDRKYFVQEITAGRRPQVWFQKYYQWLNHGGAAALFYHLLHLDLSGFDPWAAPPVNESKLDMIRCCYSDIDLWLDELPTKIKEEEGGRELYQASDLVRMYDPERKGLIKNIGMGKALKRNGFKKKTVRIGTKPIDLWDVTKQWSGREGAEWAEHYRATALHP